MNNETSIAKALKFNDNSSKHYGPKTVPEVSTVKQNNKVFREYESKGLPYLSIRKGRKYSKIEYDFIATPNQLKEEAIVKLERLAIEMGLDSKLYKGRVICSMGRIIGISLKAPIGLCRKYAPLFGDIVFNPNNWELSESGKTQMALDSDDPVKAMFELEMERLRDK